MRKVLKLAWRDYKATVCTKGFVIGLVVAPVFMCGSGIVIALTKNRVDTRDLRIAVVDRSGFVAATIAEAAAKRNRDELHEAATGKKVRPAYLFEILPPSEEAPDVQKLQLSDRVRRGELHAFLDIGKSVAHPRADRTDPKAGQIAYHAENSALDDVRRWLPGPVNEALRKRRLAEAGISESSAASADLFDWRPVDGFGLISADAGSGKIQAAGRASEFEAVLLPIIPVMLLFLLVMIGAMPQLQTVMEEKSQRIAEVMLGCLRPFQFMMGKLLGGTAVSLTGALFYVVGAIVVVSYLGYGQYIPYAILPWFLAYLTCAAFLFGSILAGLGSACNDATEAQSVTFPAMIPIVLPLFALMPVLKAPNGALATGLSFVPPFTPFLMLLRQNTPAGVPSWQPWLGLLLVAGTAVLFVWLGGRVFRVGILVHGTPPRIKNLLRWALRG